MFWQISCRFSRQVAGTGGVWNWGETFVLYFHFYANWSDLRMPLAQLEPKVWILLGVKKRLNILSRQYVMIVEVHEIIKDIKKFGYKNCRHHNWEVRFAYFNVIRVVSNVNTFKTQIQWTWKYKMWKLQYYLLYYHIVCYFDIITIVL